ncbi:serine hydrolase [Paracrocinitomix mangrovi]|uniref:serine hydrolase domain-containing protein n=1 Tax=Paracrocinitomix mangrovi TaxID=2862509 RepID=UPI001C8D1F0C|nr:serine hydrolase [Paracrocinitomix mangrovi]UKN00895.1 serine hydrolase [Paracrocinitomix mangrovi]
MLLSRLSLLVFSLLIVVLSSCGGDEIKETSDVEFDDSNTAWIDSIFGDLSAKEQYYQHLIFEIPATYQTNADSLITWIGINQPGAIKFQSWNYDSIQYVKQAVDTLDIIQPIYYTNFFEFLNLPKYPYWDANVKNQSLKLTRIFQKGRMNLLDFQGELNPQKEHQEWIAKLKNEQSVFPVTGGYKDKNVKEEFEDFMKSLSQDNHLHLSIFQMDTVDFNNFRNNAGFKGLFIVESKEGAINGMLSKGADLLVKNIELPDQFDKWNEASEEYEQSTKRILDLKSQINNDIKEQHLESEATFSRLNYLHNGVTLIADKSKLVPFKGRFNLYAPDKLNISLKVRRECNVSNYESDLTLKSVEKIVDAKGSKVIVLSDTVQLEVLDYLNGISKEANTLVCFSSIEQYSKLSASPNLCFIPSINFCSPDVFVQQLSSRINLDGNFVSKDSVLKGKEVEKTLLARTVPEFVGYDQDTLYGINWAVKNAMNGRAFPGCQVLLAKNGCIIYDQQFGFHSYDRQKQVTEESIYDLASITKVLATTMVGMKLYEMGKYNLQDSLEDYLPDTLRKHLPYPSTIRNITFHELFIHKSGLPAGFPLIRFLDYTSENVGRFDKYYCDISDTAYCIEVAENFYMEKEYEDSMWLKLNQIWLDKNKPYKYSDVNMNTLYYMFKSIIQNSPRDFGFTEPAKKLKDKDLFVEFLYNTYYKPLGMDRSRYKPLLHFNKNGIVPTENESFWRKQLLQGYVHDPNAALMGGIAGNAGLFSTTNDMAKLCQMLLNKGTYGGKRYLKTETVQKFTSVAEDSHRGLGFNKRTISTTGFGMADSSSIDTYGHTGFTGTCFWIDPQEDLIYIFLSNRVHPKVNNRIYQYGIRKRIHNTAYAARLNY